MLHRVRHRNVLVVAYPTAERMNQRTGGVTKQRLFSQQSNGGGGPAPIPMKMETMMTRMLHNADFHRCFSQIFLYFSAFIRFNLRHLRLPNLIFYLLPSYIQRHHKSQVANQHTRFHHPLVSSISSLFFASIYLYRYCWRSKLSCSRQRHETTRCIVFWAMVVIDGAHI